jgi:tetratricopeptide (TPR) repeat protein
LVEGSERRWVMGQVIRCPLIGTRCPKKITIHEKTFFLAEAEEPEYDKKHRNKAISEAIADGYKIRSALEEKGINAFTCKICEMMQTCAYGMADISQNNANVLLELGMMLALGKPTIILLKKEQTEELELFSDLKAIEVIPFEEYLDIIDQLREVVPKLPPPVLPPNPIQDLEDIKPRLAKELKGIKDDIVKEFNKNIKEARLETISLGEEKKEISPGLDNRLKTLEEKLDDLTKLGFPTDAKTAFLRGNYYYNQRRYKEALTAYNWSLELRPNDPVTLNNRGNTYHELEKYDEALADYNRSLELRPDDPSTLYNRGNTYNKLEKYDEALADFNRSLELRPDDPSTLNNRGITYTKLKKYDEALADFNRSLELRPDHPSTLYNLACLLSLWGKPNDALTYLKKAIDKDKQCQEDAKTDKDFDNIKDDPRFKKLVGED